MFCTCLVIFFFKQKTAYEMRISDWSSDVCSSDLVGALRGQRLAIVAEAVRGEPRFGLHRGRVGHARPPGSALAIAGDRGIDDPGIAGRDRFIVEAERGERTGAEILDDEIGLRAKAQREVAGARRSETNAEIAVAGILLGIIARQKRK